MSKTVNVRRAQAVTWISDEFEAATGIDPWQMAVDAMRPKVEALASENGGDVEVTLIGARKVEPHDLEFQRLAGLEGYIPPDCSLWVGTWKVRVISG